MAGIRPTSPEERAVPLRVPRAHYLMAAAAQSAPPGGPIDSVLLSLEVALPGGPTPVAVALPLDDARALLGGLRQLIPAADALNAGLN